MAKAYSKDTQDRIIYLHYAEGRTYESLAEEYNIPKQRISQWCIQFREMSKRDAKIKKEYDTMLEICRLKQEVAELKVKEKFWKKTMDAALQKLRRID